MGIVCKLLAHPKRIIILAQDRLVHPLQEAHEWQYFPVKNGSQPL
jgi:hypothetical protein